MPDIVRDGNAGKKTGGRQGETEKCWRWQHFSGDGGLWRGAAWTVRIDPSEFEAVLEKMLEANYEATVMAFAAALKNRGKQEAAADSENSAS